MDAGYRSKDAPSFRSKLGIARLPLEPPPREEEQKARAFKDNLTVQSFLQKGLFWDAIRDVRERRGIVASRQLLPSGPEISELIFPEMRADGERDFFERYDDWVADLREVEKRCVPTRLRDSAEWEAFISACVLCDPPEDLEYLDAFARHGDLRFFDYSPGKGDRAPMQAAAPVRHMVAEESGIVRVCFWLFDRLLEELGKRYLGPAGIDVDEAIQEILNTTDLNNHYHGKKAGLRREWHIVASEGVNANDIKKAAAMLPAVREARSEGGRPPRNPLVALLCARLYDAADPSTADFPKGEGCRILAARYSISENEVDEYVKRGRELISEAERD